MTHQTPDALNIGISFDALRMFLSLHATDPDADLDAAVEACEAQVKRAVEQRLDAAESRAREAEQRLAVLEQALRVIHRAVRGDEKSECWTIRKWLDERDIFNDDLGVTDRLIESVCAAALSPKEPQR